MSGSINNENGACRVEEVPNRLCIQHWQLYCESQSPRDEESRGLWRMAGGKRLPVTCRLQVEEVGVSAALQHQLVVGALLDEAAVLEEEDAVRHAHRAEAV